MSYINIESSLGTKFISNDCYDYEASSSGSSPLYHTALSNPQSPFFRIPERYVVASVPPPLPPNPSSSPLGTLQDRPSSDDRTVARHSQINIQKQGVAPHPGRPRITVDTSLPFRQRSKYLGHSTYAYSASADGPRQYPTSLSHPPGSKSALPKPKQRSSFVRPSRLCTTVNNIYTCAICNGGRGQANGNHISYSADDVTQLASPFLSSSFGRHAAAITAASTAGSTPQNDNELVSSATACFEKLRQCTTDASHQTNPIEWIRCNKEHVGNLTHALLNCEFSICGIYPRFAVYTLARIVFCSSIMPEVIKLTKLSNLLNMLENWKAWDDISALANHQIIKGHLLACLKSINEVHGTRYHDPDNTVYDVLRLDALAIDALLLATLQDRVKYRRLVKLCGQEAQAILNLLQARLGFPLNASLKCFHLGALIKLSRTSGLFPECMVLKGIELVGKAAMDGGSYGDIWKGMLGSQGVAVKVLKIYQKSDKDKLLREFSAEAVIWRQLHHPNVLPFYGVFHLENGRLCLASPWMNNGNIRCFLHSAPKTECVPLMLDIAEGLNYLHTLKPNIIHGDIKGVNILMTQSLRACLADFGLATAKETQSMAGTSAATTKTAGTLRWQAPELLKDDDISNSPASDIFAYACVCFELFSDHLPFHEVKNDCRIISMVALEGRRPARPLGDLCRIRGLNDDIWDIIEICWAQEPNHRPSASDIVNRLHAALTWTDERPHDELDSSFPSRTLYSQADHPFSTFTDSQRC